MHVSDDITAPGERAHDRLAQLEERVSRIEAQLGLSAHAADGSATAPPPPALAPVFTGQPTDRDDWEFTFGQQWFAHTGVAILTAGVLFLLSLPYPRAPALAPSLAGFALVTLLLWAAHRWPRQLPAEGRTVRSAAMVVLSFAALRLFYFSAPPAMNANGPGAHAVLLAVTVFNVAIARRCHSPWLEALALANAGVLALAVGTPAAVLVTVTLVAMVAVILGHRERSSALLLAGLVLTYAMYLAWALGNPFRTGDVRYVHDPVWAPAVVLILMPLLGLAPLLRLRAGSGDDMAANFHAALNCGLGYGAFLLHTAAAFPARFVVCHLAAAVMALSVAIAFFVRTQSRVSTFFYALTGYAALTFAIVKAAPVPDVYVWLSVQSLIVVATAIGFRSRFIVVANVFIFAIVAVTYAALAKQESGISLIFGVVALVTARILEWKQHRLELKTGFLRNAYLASAFVIFPYAGYHLVGARAAALVWIALAAMYYLLNVVVRDPKYRWMAHGTMVLTTLYVLGLGVSRFDPAYRVLSFLVLGSALILLSRLFSRARRRHLW